jgi:hypothetical protein
MLNLNSTNYHHHVNKKKLQNSINKLTNLNRPLNFLNSITAGAFKPIIKKPFKTQTQNEKSPKIPSKR